MKSEHVILLALAGLAVWYLLPPEGHVEAFSTTPIPNDPNMVPQGPLPPIDFSDRPLDWIGGYDVVG